MSESPLRLERVLDIAYVNLRGDSQNAELQAAVRDVCKTALPDEANTVVGEACMIFWLGPDEWMLVGDNMESAGLAPELAAKLADQHVAINDVSGGLVCYRGARWICIQTSSASESARRPAWPKLVFLSGRCLAVLDTI
jgi:sarcosine oxidase gamma subunit